ncbi:Dynamin-related protein 1D [Bienertia sinuspersici]
MKKTNTINRRNKEQLLSYTYTSVAVVENLNSVKFSIIEALVGRNFLPRGTDFVSRTPLVL